MELLYSANNHEVIRVMCHEDFAHVLQGGGSILHCWAQILNVESEAVKKSLWNHHPGSYMENEAVVSLESHSPDDLQELS